MVAPRAPQGAPMIPPQALALILAAKLGLGVPPSGQPPMPPSVPQGTPQGIPQGPPQQVQMPPQPPPGPPSSWSQAGPPGAPPPGQPGPQGQPPLGAGPQGQPGMNGAPPQPPGSPAPGSPLQMGSDEWMAMSGNPLMMIQDDQEQNPTTTEPLPLYRERWQDPPKPDDSLMQSLISDDRNELVTLNYRFRDNIQRITSKKFGVFADFDEDVEETWPDPALRIEEDVIQALVGTIPPAFESPRLRPFDDDEAQAKEDFLSYLHDQHRRQHARNAWADLDMEMTKSIVRYGRVITSSFCNFNGAKGASPFRMRLVDPGMFWGTTRGGDGLVRATLVYQATVSDVIGWHDDDQGTIQKQLVAIKNDDSGELYRLNDLIEVMEYWDCRWMGVYAAGMLVKGPLEHRYGEPPFVITTAPWGTPGFTRTLEASDRYYGHGSGSISGNQMDTAEHGLSYFHTRFETHARHEALMGRLLTRGAMWGNEALWIQRQSQAAGLDVPETSRASGAVNVLPEGFELIKSPDADIPPVLPPILQAINETNAKAGLGPQDYGLAPAGAGGQTSGYAIAGLSEAGKQKLAPITRTKEMHHAMVGEQRLRFYRDWGHLLGEHGTKGSLTFPKAMPGSNPKDDSCWVLTPEMIDRTGWQVNCHLIETPDPQTLGTMANAFTILKQSGGVSREDIIRLSALPGSRNPRQKMREIDIESLKEMPEYKLADLLKWVVEESGDPMMADFIMAQISRGQQKLMMSQMQPPGGGPGGPPQGPGGPGPSAPLPSGPAHPPPSTMTKMQGQAPTPGGMPGQGGGRPMGTGGANGPQAGRSPY